MSIYSIAVFLQYVECILLHNLRIHVVHAAADIPVTGAFPKAEV